MDSVEASVAEEVSAGGVIVDGGEFLVLRHARGEWIMPKGHIEAGETDEVAALREVLEETNLAARIVERIGETRYTFRRKEDGGLVDKRVRWFLMELVSGRKSLVPRTREGIVSAEWLPREAATARLTFPGDREILARAAQLANR